MLTRKFKPPLVAGQKLLLVRGVVQMVGVHCGHPQFYLTVAEFQEWAWVFTSSGPRRSKSAIETVSVGHFSYDPRRNAGEYTSHQGFLEVRVDVSNEFRKEVRMVNGDLEEWEDPYYMRQWYKQFVKDHSDWLLGQMCT